MLRTRGPPGNRQSSCIRKIGSEEFDSLLNINAVGELTGRSFGYCALLLWEFKVTSQKQEGNCSKTSHVQLNILSKGDESSRLMAQETEVCPDGASYKYES